MVSNRAYGFASWVINNSPDYETIASQFDIQLVEASRSLVEAVLDFAPSFQDVGRYTTWNKIRAEARNLKGE